jgi:hypothetical protein
LTSDYLNGYRVLALPMPSDNDADAATVREYLITLLRTLWVEGSEFSGKKPFGNSGWESDLHIPLIQAGFIDGAIDEDGYLDHSDDDAADRLILAAINALGESA